jgi:glutaredoxin 3|tara:strand:+ start:131 stop:508 length:378 start_codon:yes stop_codon:yes gene_type:complete
LQKICYTAVIRTVFRAVSNVQSPVYGAFGMIGCLKKDECPMAKVEVYATEWCPYCKRARKLLEEKGAKYQLIDVMMEPKRKKEMMDRANGRHTVPQIFINDEHIGGCDELMALEAADKLDAKLSA